MSKPKKEAQNSEPALVVREWEIWHSYSSYLTSALPPLETIAKRLISGCVAECAMLSDGVACWNTDDPGIEPKSLRRRQRALGHGKVRIELSDESRVANITLPEGVAGYVREALFQSAYLRSRELRLFAGGSVPGYVRAFLGACNLEDPRDEGSAVTVYPQIKIFETGVVMVELRMIAGSAPLYAQEFIRRFVNASFRSFGRAMVPPGIAAWAPYAVGASEEVQWYRRPRFAQQAWKHERAVRRRAVTADEGDFSFLQSPLRASHDERADELVLEATTPAALEAAEKAAREAVSRRTAAADEEARSLVAPVEEEYGLLLRLRSGLFSARHTVRRLFMTKAARQREDAELMARLGDDVVVAMETAVGKVVRRAKRFRKEHPEALGRDPDSLQDLALTLLDVAAYVGCGRRKAPRSLAEFLLFGDGSRNTVGGRWSGRPHVHLLRFANQDDSATTNGERFGDAFGSIVSRTEATLGGNGRRLLPASSRLFDDLGAYVTQAATLWVHGRAAFESSNEVPWRDQNRGHLIYEHQAKAEVLDYGYSLYRRIAERATDRRASMEQLLATERDLLEFEWAVHDASRFGEIKDLLVAGWAASDMPRLRQLVSESLRVRRDEEANRRSVAINRWTAFLTAAGGVLAVPTVAESVIKPLWHWRGWWLPQDADAAKLLQVAVTAGILGLVFTTAYRLVRHSARDLNDRKD